MAGRRFRHVGEREQPLTGGGTYEWQVKALNNAGEAAASDGWRTFTVAAAPPPPAPVQKASPASGATVGTSTPTLTWTSSLTDVAYSVCWGTTAGGESCALAGGWAPNGQALSKVVSPALAPGTYYWQVRAQTATGYAYGNGAAPAWWAFTVPGTPPPGAFTLTAPASGATNQPTTVSLSWGASSGAASYTYCLDPTLNGSCSATWQSAGAATSVTVTGLTSGATYEWHVRATNGTGTTDATSGWRTFTVAAAAPLVKTSPASGTTGLGSPVILTWTSTLTDVAYTVCWDQTDNGTCSGVWWPNGGSKVKWLENLAPGTYYWQVRAQTPTGYVYADGETTYWAFTVGSDPAGEAGASGPSVGEGPMGRPLAEPSAWPMGVPLVMGLLALTGVLGLRRRRLWQVRRWAVPAWLSLVALLWPAGVVAQTGERVEYYHLDALGSVRVVTGANGQVLRRHDYRPFGEEVSPSYPSPDRKLFTGQERDTETALDYFGARYYRADLGRFTTVDPELDIKDALVEPQRWNRYAYVTNNPLKYTDPDGKVPVPILAGGIGAVVFGGWQVYQNVQQGQPWSRNIGFQAGMGFAFGATLGLAGPALASSEIQLGIATAGAGEVIAGPYGQVTRDALERAAASTGSTVEVVTRLTSAPQAGRALSAAGGQGAEALANASRSGGTLFTAQIPSGLLKALQSAGLVQVKTTLMNGAVSTEYRFLPNATQFIVKYFQKQKQ